MIGRALDESNVVAYLLKGVAKCHAWILALQKMARTSLDYDRTCFLDAAASQAQAAAV